ncbi:YEATS domain-containing protein 4-like [Oscarella lobularis]|uniref:YEATS domain-containing protein 4-like n=1 Tax=Oscarella lobularis TaxID=121494 RepID=UPI003313D423
MEESSLCDTGGRVKGVTIVKPIIYGNIARYFGKKREEDGHTHSWTIYVRPCQNEDISIYIKKVHFKLHESYPTPVRVINNPPFEIQETGWGEFEIQIKIFFVDPTEKPLTLYHMLKLFHTDPAIIIGKKNLVSEQYDEIVFNDPTPTMHHALSNPVISALPVRQDSNTDYEELEEKTLEKIAAARKTVKQDIGSLSERLKIVKESIQFLKREVEQAESTQLEDLTL